MGFINCLAIFYHLSWSANFLGLNILDQCTFWFQCFNVTNPFFLILTTCYNFVNESPVHTLSISIVSLITGCFTNLHASLIWPNPLGIKVWDQRHNFINPAKHPWISKCTNKRDGIALKLNFQILTNMAMWPNNSNLINQDAYFTWRHNSSHKYGDWHDLPD